MAVNARERKLGISLRRFQACAYAAPRAELRSLAPASKTRQPLLRLLLVVRLQLESEVRRDRHETDRVLGTGAIQVVAPVRAREPVDFSIKVPPWRRRSVHPSRAATCMSLA